MDKIITLLIKYKTILINLFKNKEKMISTHYADFITYATANPRAFELLGQVYLTAQGLGEALITAAGTSPSYSVSTKVVNLDTENINHFLAWAEQVCGC